MRCALSTLGAALSAVLLVACSNGVNVIDGHGIGPVIACPAVACHAAVTAVEGTVGRPISSLTWHEEIFLDRNGSPYLVSVSGLSRPVGVAVVTLDDGRVTAVSVGCGPLGCTAYP